MRRCSLCASLALAVTLVLLTGRGSAHGIAAVLPASATTAELAAASTLAVGPIADLTTPSVRGWNASLSYSASHDSLAGWSNLVVPGVSYVFNSKFSADVSLPFYATVNAYPVKAKVGVTPKLKSLTGELGDAVLDGHGNFDLRWVNFLGTATLGVPTGDSTYGLSTGRATWNENNHFERQISRFTPDAELGIGNSATLSSRRVRRNYTSLGTLAFFQLGSSFDLKRLNIDFEGYEQMPLGDQKVYTWVNRKKNITRTFKVPSAAEDNGFNVSVDVPINGHLSATTSFDRSIRLDTRTVSFGINLLLRAPAQANVAYAAK